MGEGEERERGTTPYIGSSKVTRKTSSLKNNVCEFVSDERNESVGSSAEVVSVGSRRRQEGPGVGHPRGHRGRPGKGFGQPYYKQTNDVY